MKSIKLVPLILLLTIAGSVDAEWSLAPRVKIPAMKAQPEVASIVRDDPPMPPQPLPPSPTPTPVPPPPPTVTIPETYKSSMGIVMLKATCSDPVMVDGLIWESPDDLTFHTDIVELKPGAVFATADTPGTKKIRAIGAVDNRPAMSNWCVITVMGPQPPPKPDPVPDPTPKPPSPVTATNLTIVTIDDVTTRTPARAAMLTDPFWFSLTAPKFKYFKLDINSAGVATKYAAPLLMKGGQPIIVVFNTDTGAWLNKNPDDLGLPVDRDGLRKLLAKYGGQL